MILEDQILAYLDGALGEEESAELLHTLSTSPEKRAILEEHLRMRDIIALGQRSLNVPAAVERSLAERIPILGQSNSDRLIAPIARAARPTGVLSGLLLGIRSFVASHTIATALTLGTLAAAGGLVWYAGAENSNSDFALHHTHASGSRGIENSATQQGSTQASTNIAGNNANNLEVSNASPGQFQYSANASQGAEVVSKSENSSTTIGSHRDIASTHIRSGSQRFVAQRVASNAITPNSIESNSAASNSTASNSVASNDRLNATNLNHNAGDEALDQSRPIAIVTARNSATKHSPSFRPSSTTGLLAGIPVIEQESKAQVWTVGVSYGSYQYRMPSAGQTDSTSSGAVANPELSIALAVSPHFAVGLEAGTLQYATLSNVASERPVAGLVGYSELSYTSVLKSSQAAWSRVMVRYTLNPSDEIQLHATASGGASFQSRTSPNAAVSLGISRELFGGVILTGSAVASGTWSSVNSASSNPMPIPMSFGTVGVVQATAITQNIFTPAFGVRFGVSYLF